MLVSYETSVKSNKVIVTFDLLDPEVEVLGEHSFFNRTFSDSRYSIRANRAVLTSTSILG